MSLTAQNVGVNVDNPTATLDVDGNFRLTDGTQGNGKVLTSDINGFASWQTNSTTSSPPTAGFGQWNPCDSPNLCEYQPALDGSGTDILGAGNFFGSAVDIDGEFAVVSAAEADHDGVSDSGEALIYQFINNQWTLVQVIADPTPGIDDYFADEVKISGNFIFIGTSYQDGPSGNNQGSVCIFQYNGSTWSFLQKLYGNDAETNDYFGSSIAVDNNTLVVGAHHDKPIGSTSAAGSVTFFNYNIALGIWTFDQKIFHPTLLHESRFGVSVSLDNDKLVVGANGSNSYEGSAHVYHKLGTSWVWIIDLILSTSEVGDRFGRQVAIEGDDIVVSAPAKAIGSVADVGIIAFFRFNGITWQEVRIKELFPNEYNQAFGSRIDLSNGYLIVSSYQSTSVAGNYEGKSIIYQKVNNNWIKFEEITDPDSSPGDGLYAAAIDGLTKRFAVGAPYYDEYRGKIIFGKFKN